MLLKPAGCGCAVCFRAHWAEAGGCTRRAFQGGPFHSTLARGRSPPAFPAVSDPRWRPGLRQQNSAFLGLLSQPDCRAVATCSWMTVCASGRAMQVLWTIPKSLTRRKQPVWDTVVWRFLRTVRLLSLPFPIPERFCPLDSREWRWDVHSPTSWQKGSMPAAERQQERAARWWRLLPGVKRDGNLNLCSDSGCGRKELWVSHTRGEFWLQNLYLFLFSFVPLLL